MQKIWVTILLLLALSNFALAHGEDKHGPNGGYIRMPGAFHTEVVPDKIGTLRVYLLDIQFENPSVKDSELKAFITKNKKKKELKCVVVDNYFLCTGAKSIKSGELVLMPKREGVQGIEAKYKLPLKLIAPDVEAESNSAPNDHSKHH